MNQGGAVMDTVSYKGFVLPNVPFNRLAIAATEALSNAVARSSKLTDRDMRVLVDFVTTNQRTFTLLPSTVERTILEFWDKASLIRSSPSNEYMVSFLMEVNSLFLTMLPDGVNSAATLLADLYPRMPSNSEETETYDPVTHLRRNYYNSQAYIELPTQDAIAKQFKMYSWVLPWVVVSHMDYQLLKTLLQVIIQYIPHGDGNEQ